MTWQVDAGEEARLTPGGPQAALVESRGTLPLRVRATLGPAAGGRAHPGTAVVLGQGLYEVVAEEASAGRVVYSLDPWPRNQTIRDRVSYGPRIVRAAQQERRRRRREPLAAVARLPLELLAALLPAPERSALAARAALDTLRGTLLLGMLQIFVAGVLWPAGLVQFFRDREAQAKGEITRAQREITERDIAEAALYSRLGYLLYLISPTSLALLYLGGTGFARLLNARMHGQALGDPLVSAVLGLARTGRRRGALAARLAELGPERPDHVIHDGPDLVVISAREKPLWSERATIQVGEAFYKLRHVDERRDGRWTAFAYRLTPVEPGAVFRALVRYDRPGPETSATSLPTPLGPQDGGGKEDAAAAAGEPAAALPGSARAAGPTVKVLWRVDDGEQARLTPFGPTAAVVESLGALPLRPRSPALGVHHRPEFPGTCVVLEAQRYEVVEEQPLDAGFRYLLEPWPADHVQRDAVEYGPTLVRAAQQERDRAVFRARAAFYSRWLLPFLGLLPESRQIIACERYGLDASDATLGGALLEIAATLGLLAAFYPLSLALVPPAVALVIVPALLRGLGALAWGELGGSALLGFAEKLGPRWRQAGLRFDPTVLPITREAFWARLGLADRQDARPDGALVVWSVLPHVSWTADGAAGGRGHALRVGNDHWDVAALPPVVERGRLTYAYQLSPRSEGGGARPPDPRHYQEEVLEGVARGWDYVFQSAPWLPCLLPIAVQERAYRQRGGVAAARRYTLITAAAELPLAAWFVTGAGAMNVATGLFFAVEAGVRLWRCGNEEFAPSVIGRALADYLRPERLAYHVHRDAERDAQSRVRQAAENGS